MVQFGRRVNVTVGKTVTRGGETARNVQAFDVGTIVRVDGDARKRIRLLKADVRNIEAGRNSRSQSPLPLIALLSRVLS
jgi:hypothetical protein